MRYFCRSEQGGDQARDEFRVSRMISGAKEKASCGLDLLSKEQTQAQTFVVRAGWAAIRIEGRVVSGARSGRGREGGSFMQARSFVERAGSDFCRKSRCRHECRDNRNNVERVQSRP